MNTQPEEPYSLKLVAGTSLQNSFRVGENILQNKQMEWVDPHLRTS